MRKIILFLLFACSILTYSESFAAAKVKLTRGTSVTLKKLNTSTHNEAKRSLRKKAGFLRTRPRATVGGISYPSTIGGTDYVGLPYIPYFCHSPIDASGTSSWFSISVDAFDAQGNSRPYDEVWAEAQRQKGSACWSLYNCL